MIGRIFATLTELTPAEQAAASVVPCDGSTIPAMFPGLISKIGPTTPDLRGRVPIGSDVGYTEVNNGLIAPEMLPAVTDDGNTDEPVSGTQRTVAAKAGGGETIYSTDTPDVPQAAVIPPSVGVFYYVEAS